jgi:hypothetical protein
MKPSQINPGETETLGAHLERDRLMLRGRRIAAVIAALRQQTDRARPRDLAADVARTRGRRDSTDRDPMPDRPQSTQRRW